MQFSSQISGRKDSQVVSKQVDSQLTMLELACERFPWDAKKLILQLKQSREIDISAEAISFFSILGIIEPDHVDGATRLKVSSDYEHVVRSVKVIGLISQYPQKGVNSKKRRRRTVVEELPFIACA